MPGFSNVSLSAFDAVTCLFRFAGVAAVFAAALTDLRGRIIPHRIVAVVLAGGLVLTCARGLADAGPSLLLAAGLGAALFALSALGALGGGDAKLIPAAVLLFPFNGALAFLYWTAISGGVLGLLFLVMRRMRFSPAGAGRVRAWVQVQVNDDLPFAVAIAIGAATALVLPS